MTGDGASVRRVIGDEARPEIPGVTNLVRIGGGGFGDVWRGDQEQFGRHVAVKVLRTPELDRKARGRFDREVALMGRLSAINRNVLMIHSAGYDRGRPYLLTEYCPGGTLADNSPLPPPLVVKYGGRIAEVLRQAHQMGIVHRDVKPANILLRADGEPVLADFGLSIRPAQDQSLGLEAFSMNYAAPETLRDAHHDPAGDMYALGATLYALIEGQPPFRYAEGEAPLQFMMRVLREQPPPLLRPGVPDALRDVVFRLLAKDPAARPAAASVAELLSPGLHDETRTRRGVPDISGVFAEPTIIRPKTTKSGSRTGLIVGAAALVVVVSGGVGWFALRDNGSDHDAAPALPIAGTAASSSAPAGPNVVLAAPVDHGGSVDLTWTGERGTSYAVIVGGQGEKATAEFAGGATTRTVKVDPDRPYCFLIQATRGGAPVESNVQAIRGAICRF